MRPRPVPRDPVRDFVNRFAEKQTVNTFCDRAGGTARCLVLRTGRDVGLTFFLRHLEESAESPLFTVYADCASNDPEVIFRRFFEKLEERKLLRWRAQSLFRELGEAAIRLLGALFLPAGAVATVAFAGAVVPKIATSAYASKSSERFSRLVTSGRWRDRIVFLVDNAQRIKPESMNILNTVFSDQYDHVRFVLSFVDEDDADYKRFLQRVENSGLGVEVDDFPPPDEQLVAELAGKLKVRLSRSERIELVRASGGSINSLLGFLLAERSVPERLSPVEQEILRYLLVAEQPLRKDDIQLLILESERVQAPDSAVRKAIAALAAKRLVAVRTDTRGDEVEVTPGQSRSIREAIPERDDHHAVQELYRYFSTVEETRIARHSPSAYGALLYKLAKRIDPASVGKWAFELVRISLEQADLAAARQYVVTATAAGKSRSAADLYALVAFYVSIQEYEQALDTLDALGTGYWSGIRVLRIIHAIALNRVRSHQSAQSEIEGLLAEPETTPEEFALLTSYRIAGMLHEGMLDEARDVFEAAHPRICLARNRGYALRNAAAVYFWGKAQDPHRAAAILDEAMGVFESDKDAFGRYTTLNNRAALTGSAYPRDESAAKALADFRKAFEKLAVFGTQHIEEVGANVGVALLLSRQPKQAATHLRKVSAIASPDFPKVIMESALAFAEVMLGQAVEGRERARNLIGWIPDVRLPEAVYRAYVNAAAIEAAIGARDSRFDVYIEGATRAGFWAGTASLDRLVGGVKSSAVSTATLPEYLSYDYFQYWSQNPLSVMAAPVLPEKAICDDVLQ